MERTDLAIIGAGPAGMSAAIFAKNDSLDFKIMESKEEGWFPKVSIDSHYQVDNYLGFNNISGTELIKIFKEHLKNKGIPVEKGEVVNIIKSGQEFLIESKGLTQNKIVNFK